MKTIKEGSLKKLIPDWVGHQFTCAKCGAIRELEEGDNVTEISRERRPNGNVVIEIPFCPTTDVVKCNNTNTSTYKAGTATRQLGE